MKLLQVTILCLLLPSLCSSENATDVKHSNTPVLTSAAISPTKASVPTPTATSNRVTESTAGTSIGTTSKKLSSTSSQPTHSSLTTTVKGEGTTTSGVTKTELTVTNATVTKILLLNASSTLPSSQNKSSPLSSDASSPHTSTLPSVSGTTPGNNSQLQGMTSVCMSVDMCLLDPFSPRKSYKSFFNSFIEVGLKYKTKLHTGAKAGTQETLNVIHRCLTLIVVIVSRVKAFVHTHQTVYINSLPISIYKTELFLRMREVLLPLEASHLEITEASLNGSGGRIVRIGIHQPSDLLFFFLKIIGTEDAKNASSSSASPSYSGNRRIFFHGDKYAKCSNVITERIRL
uniref:Uncharacterized protein n=1 Tax=Ursus americanus TaxID=9643 RepID=A0A452QW43_URSAM